MPLFIELCLYGGLVLGSWGLIRLIVVIVKGRVALRVDEHGVRMTKLAWRDKVAKRRTTFTPWESIDLLLVNHEPIGASSDTFLYVCRYVDGAEVRETRLAVAGWELNRDKLVAAARRWSPKIDFDERYEKKSYER